ncbi:hypothetical protein FA13DRAFT_305051 [Coprinellus micaceus]|uniref:Uncharacterized protein n=1 Tax=Coprinellus micaceus TaxID=71717 RepID=A0A4Y7SE46_COPMI|nr:hypothetical protein FA13DRAFT_305051 [Coprinellus micaceus]
MVGVSTTRTTNQGSTTTPATAPNQGSWLFQNHGKEATRTPTGALSVWGALRDTLVYMLGSTGAKQREGGAESSDANFIMPLMDDPAELPPHRHSPIFHIYVRALLAEGYGLPCWKPAPSDPEAQPKGVVPGDVGTYTAEGGFRRTFNLFDNADVIHKIAQRTQTCIQVSHCNPSPETFTRPGMLPKGEVMVEGASSRKPSYSPPPMDVVYEFRRFPDAPDGAILALTSSADKEETTSLDEMGRYINQHAEAIYRHATTIHPIGKDESLYIVTGCIKSDSWAMAAYRHGMDPRHDTLRLEPVRKAYGGYPPRYKWAEQGSSRAHVGRSDRRCVKDQVLFLLGFKVAFSKPFRNRIEVDLNSRADNPTSPGSGGPDTGGHHDQSSTFGRGSPSGYSLGRGSGGGSASGQAHHTGRNRGCTLSSQPSDPLPQKPKTGCSNDTHDVPCEPSPHSGETYDVEGYHPSDAINALLLQQTGCDIAVCHDDSWRLLLQSCHSLLADNKGTA